MDSPVWIPSERIEKYSVSAFQLESTTPYHDRQIQLLLANGHLGLIQFPEVRPKEFIKGGVTSAGVPLVRIKMPLSQFDSVYHLLQTESPVYLTVLHNIFPTVDVASVHTDKELVDSAGEITGLGEVPGEGLDDPDVVADLLLYAMRGVPAEKR
jgi:hypothetical protein